MKKKLRGGGGAMMRSGPLMLLALLVLAVALESCTGLSLPEDDLVFDDEAPGTREPEQPRQSVKERKRAGKKWRPVERLLGMPDAVAAVGHVFKLHVPKQAFSGNIDYYEVKGTGGKGLVRWLRWDEPAAVLYGVPSRKDVGRHKIRVKAYGKRDDVAEDSFYIHVVPENREHHGEWRKRCTDDQDRTMLTLLADAKYDNLNASDKVNALENLAGFLSLNTSWITIQPDVSKDSSYGSYVLRLGPGNVRKRSKDVHYSTKIQWQIGCDGHIWTDLINATRDIPEQARDGTLSEVLQLSVYEWNLRSEAPDFARNRRDARSGSGDGLLPDEEDDDDYEDEDEEYDEEYDSNESITDSPGGVPKRKPDVYSGSLPDEHPHRHHHGEDNIAGIGANINNEEDFIWRNSETNNATSSSTPSTSTIALPSSTTTTSTTSTTTTTEASTTSTTTSSTTTVTSSSSTTSTTTESPETTSSSTSNFTTETSSSSVGSSGRTEAEPSSTADNATTVETPATETPTQTSTLNVTQVVTSSDTQAPSTNVSTDSLTVDGDRDRDEDRIEDKKEEVEEKEEDFEQYTDYETTNVDSSSTVGAPVSNATEAAASTTTTTTTPSTTTTMGTSSGGAVAESMPTSAEPNVTSIYSVNATADEYPESSGSARESSTASSSSSPDNATEKVTGESLDPFDSVNVPVYGSISSSTSTSTTTETTQSTTSSTTTTTTEPPTSPSTSTTTTPEPTTPSTTTTTTTTTAATPMTTSSTTTTTTTTTTTDRTVFGARNLPPKVERRLKKIPITQGKLLSYTIPEDTFSDYEDGNTRNLRLKVYEKGAPLKSSYWLQFNQETQEVYGLPLEEQYGTYPFEVVATDSEGSSVSDRLDISVQQHKQIRAVNHEFHIYLKIEKRSEFPTNVDWELKVMRSLAELYGDSNLNYITVRSIDIDHDQAIYTWTNDSLVRSDSCPQEEINRLYRVLVADEKSEEPSERLTNVLGPQIRPKRVVYQGLEQCQQSKETQVNKYPMPRNQIDQLNATVGQLFVYRVPKDTFFDEEDGDTSSMRASLLTANRTEIPSWDWLQFDSSTQEFFGVPMKQDIGRKTYQLVVKDKEGLEATDSLVAEVHPTPVVRHVVQISMTLRVPYESFAHSAQKKREFIEKLQRLYGDKSSNTISLLSISGNPDMTTTVTWRNLTLPTYECPHEEIARIQRVLVNDNDKSFTEELTSEFPVNQITVYPMGACQDTAGVGLGQPDVPPVDDSTSVGASHDDYLITFVLPAAIIATMLVLAGLIACILYKRRRSGKMSVSEKDDERQSFRSKGIPVIFQDELEEKPDPGNKSPIILKEEKPPLPPPEYQRGAEDGADIPMLAKENSEEPYQPPPPFATNRDNNRQNRPKPTPTYRKPPPYVPP